MHAHVVWWHAPFYSGEEYSSEAIAFMLALWSAPQMDPQRLSIAQHGDSFADDAYDVSVLSPLNRGVCGLLLASISQPPIRSAICPYSLHSMHANGGSYAYSAGVKPCTGNCLTLKASLHREQYLWLQCGKTQHCWKAHRSVAVTGRSVPRMLGSMSSRT